MADKRFILFTGDFYYPGGGATDYRGAFETLESALEAGRKVAADRHGSEDQADWVQIAEWTPDGLALRFEWDRDHGKEGFTPA